MVLSGKTIKSLDIISPFEPRTVHKETNTSYGLSLAGYDVRLDQTVKLLSGFTVLASTMERFKMPNNIIGIVHDKSTWVRKGIAVQNTVIEPGWEGYLTLELTYSPKRDRSFFASKEMLKGTPIAQILFHRIDEVTEGYGNGKYQNQKRGPQEAK